MTTDNERLQRLAEEILADIAKYQQSIWSVYMLTNDTKKEIYFGVTNDVEGRILEHAKKDTKSIAHWDFGKDRIGVKVLKSGMTQPEASQLAHALERKYSDGLNGYRVIQTAGI